MSWRDKRPLTGGMVAQWLMGFTGLTFRDSLNQKSSIFPFLNNAAIQDCRCSSTVSSEQHQFR